MKLKYEEEQKTYLETKMIYWRDIIIYYIMMINLQSNLKKKNQLIKKRKNAAKNSKLFKVTE